MLRSPAGWYPDPWRQAPLRWWDGALWTPFVSPRATGAVAAPATGEVRSTPVLPLRAVWLAIGAVVAVQLVSRLGLAPLAREPGARLAVYLAALGLQYGTFLAVCVWASRRWGTGRLGEDLGLRFRPADVGWAVVAWLGMALGISRLVVALQALGVPFSSNNPFGGDGSGRIAIDASRLLALTLVGLVLIVAAPFFEELLCRGVVLRGLRSRFSTVPAVALQGVVFGGFHVDPARGAGNIGLVIALSSMGVVMGALAERTGRLGAGMVLHAVQNGFVFAVGVAGLT